MQSGQARTPGSGRLWPGPSVSGDTVSPQSWPTAASLQAVVVLCWNCSVAMAMQGLLMKV